MNHDQHGNKISAACGKCWKYFLVLFGKCFNAMTHQCFLSCIGTFRVGSFGIDEMGFTGCCFVFETWFEISETGVFLSILWKLRTWNPSKNIPIANRILSNGTCFLLEALLVLFSILDRWLPLGNIWRSKVGMICKAIEELYSIYLDRVSLEWVLQYVHQKRHRVSCCDEKKNDVMHRRIYIK